MIMKNNNENKILNVPNLRFPEFSGEWENCQIANILSIGSGRDYKHLEKGNIPVFGTGGYMTSVNECIYDGETTFIGRKGSINKPFYYNGKFWTVDTLFYTHSFNKTTPKFVYCLFQTINWLRYNEASGVPSLSKDTIEKIKVFIPQLDEQRKISEMLSVIDERIATQNKIIEKLQSLIKGLAAQLTQSGTPNIRLCDCLECHSSTLLENCVSVTGSYPVYGATGLIGYTNNYAYNGESILIVKDGSGVGSLSYVNDHFSVIGTLNYLTAKENYSILYLYYALMAFNFTPYITGMAIPHIYFKDYGKAKLFYPSIEKRIRIASLLHNIEQKLVVEQNLVISLSTQKSYLLRMLFI